MSVEINGENYPIANTTKLDLYSNNITILDSNIGHLVNLEKIYLNYNQLLSLPESIGNLKKLQILDIPSNRLTSLPESIGNMINLRQLNLEGNQLLSLPDSIGDLKQLQILNLEGNQLLSLPNSIKNLEHLKTLFLNNNRITSIPKYIGYLVNLEQLDLSYNQLEKIPKSIGKLEKLQILNLSYNQLTSIPASIDNLSNLHYINASNNKLASFPIMPRLINIRSFQAQNNPFTDSELIGKKDYELKEIIFSYNHILNTFIGPDQSPEYPAPYQIYMSQDFVKKTQYKPLSLDDDDLRILLSENLKPHVVYACPDGHLHSAGDCGIPTQISLCGINGCKLFVGGLHHMLVPGSYIVYHDEYKYAKIWYGNFPVESYRIYKRLLDQTNKSRQKIGKSELIIQPQTDEDNLIIARPLQEDDIISDLYLHGNVECKVCGDDIILGEDNLYILPNCGHLLHRDDVEGYREGNLSNIYEYENGEDIADDKMGMRKCPECDKKFAFGKSKIKISKRKTSKRKTSKRKTSKCKTSKRNTSKRKTSKRKTSKSKTSKRKTSKRKTSKRKSK